MTPKLTGKWREWTPERSDKPAMRRLIKRGSAREIRHDRSDITCWQVDYDHCWWDVPALHRMPRASCDATKYREPLAHKERLPFTLSRLSLIVRGTAEAYNPVVGW